MNGSKDACADLCPSATAPSPRLPARSSTFYGGDEQGYNSYPTLEEVEAQQTAAKTEPAAATTEAAATATA